MNVLNIVDVKKFISGKKIVVVTGVTGQVGSTMVDYLIKNTDFTIIGGVRRVSVSNHQNISHLVNEPRFKLVNFDLSDVQCINKIIFELQPDYFINLAAQAFVGCSWDFPIQTWQCNTTPIIHILESIRQYKPTCRFYNAGSSEEFGNVTYTPQDENHPMKPRSPYGASKSASRQLVKVYRESYNLYAVQGILFNHEGIRRGEEYVTRKITKGVAKIKHSLLNKTEFSALELGNINSYRDWSDASDFVDGIWKMMTQIKPSEYVLSSGETHSIKEFIDLSFKYADINGSWHGTGQGEEFSISVNDFHKYMPNQSVLVKINPIFYRPAEVDILLGNNTKAKKELGWDPKTTFKQLVEKMIKNDLSLLGI